MEKACTKCGEVKALSEFVKNRQCRNGVSGICKLCASKRAKENHLKNREDRLAKQKAYREANKERAKERDREYYRKNKEKIKARSSKWYYDNTERAKEANRLWREANREQYLASGKSYRDTDEYKSRMRDYRKTNEEKIREQSLDWKTANSAHVIQYMKSYRKKHYEDNKEVYLLHARKRRATKRQAYVPRCDYWRQVEVEMGEKRRELQEQTGDSYHIDHIYPLSKGGIDHPVNYQILTAKENLSKWDKVDSDCPQQARLELLSRLVLEEGAEINEAIKLANAR